MDMKHLMLAQHSPIELLLEFKLSHPIKSLTDQRGLKCFGVIGLGKSLLFLKLKKVVRLKPYRSRISFIER